MKTAVVLQIVAGLLPIIINLLLFCAPDGTELADSDAALITAAGSAIGRMAEIIDAHPCSFRVYRSPWRVEPCPTDLYQLYAMQHWREETFRANFRMECSNFERLCDALRPKLARQDTDMRQAIPVEQQVCMALYHLAQGSNYRVLDNTFAIARESLTRIIRRFADAVLEAFAGECGYPDPQRKLEIMEEFAVDGMPGCVGADADPAAACHAADAERGGGDDDGGQ
ncbi:hypothetical protein VOLCADRAFT_100456 [Volvox carteri f. nagariensis]|uniref:DUF8040 domain-containing protein n=1 Tax=Volvox carteri f. nagariensis TaxID=3068 RepID=D8UK90_VOLCA|nr:uncharacterized protein VOLCADRAFT_100456 [Volvox carteri f. nagariensis]EFJ39863.1 hypothetical protein VOLCADRAFT_100456 [Volvox carteri f. nagariensis]|eukprot:XP_002959069.1 hypothetical protein VOLCADRAFT_100456 [Volvox carteri f. nagariensis]